MTALDTVTIRKGRWCVYSHATEGVAFYVGVGVASRPFERTRRNQKWAAFVKGMTSYEVSFHLWTDDRIEALRVEAALIKSLKPACNQMMNGYTNAERNAINSRVHKGKVLSVEARQKIGATRRARGCTNNMTGRTHSEETKAKMRAAKPCCPIRCEQTGIEYPSVRAAASMLKIARSSLRDHMRGVVKHVEGLTFLRVGRERPPLVAEIRAA